MKCDKCGKDFSYSVMPFHRERCTREEVKKEIKENIEIKPQDYTLEELIQMAIDSPNRTYAPSTIKRWKEDRLMKELGL